MTSNLDAWIIVDSNLDVLFFRVMMDTHQKNKAEVAGSLAVNMQMSVSRHFKIE